MAVSTTRVRKLSRSIQSRIILLMILAVRASLLRPSLRLFYSIRPTKIEGKGQAREALIAERHRRAGRVLGVHSGSPPSGARLTVRRPPRAARNALMSSNRAFSMSRALPVRTGFWVRSGPLKGQMMYWNLPRR